MNAPPGEARPLKISGSLRRTPTDGKLASARRGGLGGAASDTGRFRQLLSLSLLQPGKRVAVPVKSANAPGRHAMKVGDLIDASESGELLESDRDRLLDVATDSQSR